MLLSFKNNSEVKEKIIASTYEWLNMNKEPKSAEEKAKEIFESSITNVSSKCILEDYENYPERLGFPLWLGNLMLTFNRHIFADFSGVYDNFKEYFYPAFLKACNVGIDYSLMFHEWELMILTEMLPLQERNKDYFLNLIDLHKNELAGKNSDINKWFELQINIDKILQDIDEFTNVPEDIKLKEIRLFDDLRDTEKRKINHTELHNKAFSFRRYRNSFSKIIWNSGRVAFLSVENFVNKENPYTTSSEALTDALWEEYINKNKPSNFKFEEEFRDRTWYELTEKLLKMLRDRK